MADSAAAAAVDDEVEGLRLPIDNRDGVPAPGGVRGDIPPTPGLQTRSALIPDSDADGLSPFYRTGAVSSYRTDAIPRTPNVGSRTRGSPPRRPGPSGPSPSTPPDITAADCRLRGVVKGFAGTFREAQIRGLVGVPPLMSLGGGGS